uniref:Uncharacterized protein n=1 Tax=Capra hircus TaxID=9925 RepID=A0A8C2RFX2_CAPHI
MTSLCGRFPQTQNISHGVWKESKRIYIQSQGFALFLPSLPAPLLPSFFLNLISFLQTKKFKIPVARPTTRKPSRRGSTLSLSRTSGGSSPQSSMISVIPGSDEPPSVIIQATGSKDIEDNESSSTKPEEEPLHISLQKLLEMVREDARRTITLENEMQRQAPSILSVLRQNKSDSAYKDMQTTRKSSRANRDIIQYKSGVCNTMRAKFYSVAQEAGFCLQDKMEILMKRQEERGIQKFHSFNLVSNFQKDIAKMRHQVSAVKADAEEIADHWYFDLLSRLPEDLKNFRPVKKILAKLQKFGENLDLRIRPHVLLKVLQELRAWELCSPDIAVAIEVTSTSFPLITPQTHSFWPLNIQALLKFLKFFKRHKSLHGTHHPIEEALSCDLGCSTPGDIIFCVNDAPGKRGVFGET